MILWINGAFGAGKTTTARRLVEAIPGARLFDPEYVGFLLREFVDVPTGDFQDLWLWRSLTVHTLAGLAAEHGDRWVVPMALLNRTYRTEIFSGLRDRGLAVRQVALVVPESTLRARIDPDATHPENARLWRQRHAALAVAEFDGIAQREADTAEIDATAPTDEVTGSVLAWLRDRGISFAAATRAGEISSL